MTQALIEDAIQLPAAERLKLIELLWDSLDEEDDGEVSDWERAVLDERLAEHYADPTSGSPWREAVQRVRDSL